MACAIAVLSQKGGTGKTTTVRTLADVLRRCGLRVLAIDLYPQANLSDSFDVAPDAAPTMAELQLAGRMGREPTLKRVLDSADMRTRHSGETDATLKRECGEKVFDTQRSLQRLRAAAT
jgi:MinD-like ATPase involved in chromosome partitioning or flagellar assembly